MREIQDPECFVFGQQGDAEVCADIVFAQKLALLWVHRVELTIRNANRVQFGEDAVLVRLNG